MLLCVVDGLQIKPLKSFWNTYLTAKIACQTLLKKLIDLMGPHCVLVWYGVCLARSVIEIVHVPSLLLTVLYQVCSPSVLVQEHRTTRMHSTPGNLLN